MKLHYKIIWIDDNVDQYIDMGISKEFEAFLANLEFIPTVDCFETGAAAEEKLNSVKYDLILSDYNIKEGEQGDTLIRKIRSGKIFTEILFYSAKENFDEVAKQLYQDRVSFLSLVGDEGFREFRQKVFWLVDLTISKLQELNNMRGLVMSETSELDNTIEDILHKVIARNDDHSAKLRKYILEKVKESVKSRNKITDKIEELATAEIIREKSLFDANKKTKVLNEYFNISGLDGIDGIDGFYKNYVDEVLLVRNDLAHAKSEEIDGEEYLIVSRQGQEHPVRYDKNECVKVRKNLNKYANLLQKVRESIAGSEAKQDEKPQPKK
jgi:hypothetical protein